MIRQHCVDSALFGFVKPAATTKAFHKVQARPRVHVSGSNGSILRKTFRLSSLNKVHVIARSQEGSPIANCPKSITALSCPFCTSRLPTLISPWIHTGGCCQVVLSAVSQISVAVFTSI